MITAFNQVLLLLLFSAVGFALCRTNRADSTHAKLLSVLSVNVFMPATAFNTVSKHFTPDVLQEKAFLIGVSLCILIFVAVSMRLFAKLLTGQPYRREIYSYSLTIPNYGAMGYPLAESLYGSAMLFDTIIFALPLTFFCSTIGYSRLTKQPLNFRRLLSPITIAIVLGIVVGLTQLQIPMVIRALVERSAACMSPVSMLLMGMVISEYHLPSLLKSKVEYLVAFMRLVILPIVICGTLLLLGLEQMVIPALMIYAMPSGLYTVIFPRMVDEDCRPGASLAAITIPLACITAPLLVTLLSC